jgi:hypothetical protein
VSAASVAHPVLGEFVLSCEGDVPLLFTENETNHERLFPRQKNESGHVKDGINDCVVHGIQDAVNPGRQATKVAAHYKVNVHGDNGAGLGASHQTGWTGLVAKLIELSGVLDPKPVLETGRKGAFEKGARQ